ncbi:MAG: hypothetical protein ABIV11_05925 [Gemmatimonadaceae bacterium]
MIRFRKLYTLVGAAALMAGSGCGDLEVTNPNNPDIARALASPEDVKNLAISSVRSWYFTATDVEPYLSMIVTADVGTANYGNFGMRFNNLEPRIAYENLSAGGDRETARRPWDFNYSALGAANDAIKAFVSGVTLPGTGETAKFRQLAQFTQAASLMNLGLIFDKAFIIDETFDPTAALPVLKPYGEVTAAATAKWEALATAAAASSFTYDPTVLPLTVGPLTSARLARISNTMAALTMALTPRNATEAATVNWAKVAQLAEKGIGTGSAGSPFDFTVLGDGNNWYSEWVLYGGLRSWLRVDHRLIGLMDGTTPPRMTSVTNVPPKGTSPDARYESDFLYIGVPLGDPTRGVYMMSVWFHKRNTCCSWEAANPGEGPFPYILAAESDLVRAEALLRSGGNRATAASLINGSRVGRGKMTPLTGAASDAVLFAAIDYERQVELMYTSGFDLFYARHGLTARLQPGTYRHLPIPAKELETLGLPIYTFGGVGKEQ